jgi:serine/threonine protein kinase
MELRPAPLRDIPDRLGRYRLIRPLSKGGMAHVFEGRRESLAGVSPKVAVKLILPEFAQKEGFQELFINEAKLGASMHHQNLVQIQDFDRDGEHFFLIMEYVEGLTLRRVIGLCARHNHPIPLGVIAEIGRQACDGLHYAHVAKDEHGRPLGLVHRDVKPSNLILNPHGVLKVLDFGISKGSLMTERKGAVKGTWGYMGPEQAHGRDVSPAADQFGLGIVLWELATRESMFPQGVGNERILEMLDQNFAAKAVEKIDPSYGALRNVLLRALQPDAAGRYPSAADMSRDLSMLLPDPITARDEVVRFYQRLDALDHGKPLPAQSGARPVTASSAGSQASFSQAGSQVEPAPMSLFSIGITAAGIGAVVVGLVALAFVGVVGWQLMQQSEDPTMADALPEAPPPLAADEPGGPAAEGAPGEQKPPPTALRGQDSPKSSRPPPSATVPAPSGSVVGSAAAATPTEPPPPEEAKVIIVRRTQETPAEAAPAPEPVKEAAPPPPPEPVGYGTVTISAAQPGFEVWIDGKLVKKGPVTNHKLPAGKHRVILYAADGEDMPFEVDVPVDGTVRKIYDFERHEFRR